MSEYLALVLMTLAAATDDARVWELSGIARQKVTLLDRQDALRLAAKHFHLSSSLQHLRGYSNAQFRSMTEANLDALRPALVRAAKIEYLKEMLPMAKIQAEAARRGLRKQPTFSAKVGHLSEATPIPVRSNR